MMIRAIIAIKTNVLSSFFSKRDIQCLGAAVLEVPLCLFSSDGFGVSWRPPSCALGFAELFVFFPPIAQLRTWCPFRFSRQNRPVDSVDVHRYLSTWSAAWLPFSNILISHYLQEIFQSIISHGLFFCVFLMKSVSGPVMHYGCTLLVVSAMVGGVVAYVAWPIPLLYIYIPVVPVWICFDWQSTRTPHTSSNERFRGFDSFSPQATMPLAAAAGLSDQEDQYRWPFIFPVLQNASGFYNEPEPLFILFGTVWSYAER